MPWKEANVVELRKEFVLEALQADLPFTALCRKYGISSKTGYKWKERFVEQGTAGLSDQSRRPIKSPAQLTEELVCKVVRLKVKHRDWGPKKIRQLYARQTVWTGGQPLQTRATKRAVDCRFQGLVVFPGQSAHRTFDRAR